MESNHSRLVIGGDMAAKDKDRPIETTVKGKLIGDTGKWVMLGEWK